MFSAFRSGFLLCCLLVISFRVLPQSIKGRIVDKSSPVEFANIALYAANDSTNILKATVTDSLGNFYLDQLKTEKYILRVQLLGYHAESISIQLDSINANIDLSNIQVQPDGKMLEGVDVVAHKNLIKKTPQGFIINAKDNLTQAGGTATDILKNTPTVVVDPEGGITIRGKAPLILINGRNSNLSSTDRIPASSVESIEIINNPSAQYDADADGGIINIKLKKNTAKGTNGSAGLGTGYGASARVSSSFIINHQAGKWNVGLAYDNRFARRTRKINANRTQYDIPQEYYLLQNRFDNRFERTQNLKFNADYTPNSKNAFNFELIGNLDGQDNGETMNSTLRTQTDSFFSKNSRHSNEIGREKVAEASLFFTHKFEDPRKLLTANISSSFNYETENTDITTQSLTEDSSSIGNPFLQRTYNYQTSNVSNFRIDYAQPVGAKGTLEMGYKGITRFTNADFQNQYYVNSEYVKNAAASNIFNFHEQVHAAYLQFRSYIGKPDSARWKYDLGLRAEQVFNQGEGVTNNVFVKRQYFNLYPTGNLIFNINPTDFLKLSFSRRINRPGLGQLNPFTDITDSLSQHSGNPYLKPELINAAEFGYNKEWKKVSLSSSIFYRYATNIIRPFLILKSNGVALTYPVNYGNSTTYGYEGIVGVFPCKWWSFNMSVSFYQQNIDGSNVDPTIANNVFSWYGKLINNFTLWKGAKLQVTGNYNSPIGTPQGQKIAIYYAEIGFQQKIMNGKGGLGIVITDVFNTQLNGYTATGSNFAYKRQFKIDTRAVMLTFAYSFGTSFKEEMIENKFSND